MKNDLNHNRKLAKLHAKVKNAKKFRFKLKFKSNKIAKQYNKATRKASKIQLSNYNSR